MTDAQIVVAALAGAIATIAGAVAAGIRWSFHKKNQKDQGHGQATLALVDNARHLAVLSERIDQFLQRGGREERNAGVARLETAATSLQETSLRLERTAMILERDARLDDAQRQKLAQIRSRISRGPRATSSAQAGGDDE